jgi:isochorismate pyruvate lyase
VAKAKAKRKSRAKAKRAAKTERQRTRRKAADWRVDCKSLGDIRARIDRLDDLIAPLMCQRQFFVNQAARFKPSVAGVVVPSRVEEIVARIRKVADRMKVDPLSIEAVYRAIIDAMTASEQRQWQELHRADR